MTPEFSMPLIIRALGRGKKGTRDLTEHEAAFVMTSILNNQITDAQLGAFLMLMRVKEETASEITGMVKSCESFTTAPKLDIAVNWPAYAGKKKQPSWYILAAKLLAQNGIRIFMHGGGEHTEGRQYARAVCIELGMPVANSLDQAATQLAKQNFSFINLEAFLPKVSYLIDMKAELGLRSPANTLVRHINPFNAPVTLQGMFHPAYMTLHHESAIQLNQQNNIVLKGDGGEFEVRPDSDTPIAVYSTHSIFTGSVPSVLKSRSIRPSKVEMTPLIELWQGKILNEYGEAATLQTAALVLALVKKISHEDAFKIVSTWWTQR